MHSIYACNGLQMELPTTYYSKDTEYVETASGNKVSRKAVLNGSQNIKLAGKASCPHYGSFTY